MGRTHAKAPPWLYVGVIVIMGFVGCDLLEEPDGSVAVQTAVEGATVYIDGDAQSTKTGNGETRYSVPAGSYDVLVFKRGYAPHLQEVSVSSDETVTVTYAEQSGTELVNEDFQQYSSSNELSAYDNGSIGTSLQTDGDRKFLRVSNDSEYYAVFDWPVSSMPPEDVVYAVSVLGYSPETSGVTLYLFSGENAGNGLYGFGKNFTFERPSDPAGTYEVLDDAAPGIAEDASTDLVIIAMGSRILVLKNGELVIDYTDPHGVVRNLSAVSAEVDGQSGDPAGTNHGEFDDLLVYSF